jgi:hypothetical protein
MKTIALSFSITLAFILASCGGGGGSGAPANQVSNSVFVPPISIGMSSVLMASDGN